MTFNPKVSIIIPVYNGANYMREAIDSALAQTYDNIEIVVVNDGSGDGGKTEEVALSYGDKIRYFHKENGGVATALNLGIQKMTGEYFSWLSHDDVYHPHKVQCQVDYLSRMEDKNIILYSDFECINDKSRSVALFRIKNLHPDEFRLALITGYPIHGCTALIPKKCFDTVGLFDPDLKTTQDYDLWFKMSGEFKFIHTPDILVKSRIHAEQGSRTIPNHLAECNKLYTGFLNQISTETSKYGTEFLTSFFCKTAFNLLERKFDEAARRSFQLAVNNITEQQRYSEHLKRAISAVNTDSKQLSILQLGSLAEGNFLNGDIFRDNGSNIGQIIKHEPDESTDFLDEFEDNSFDLVISYSVFTDNRGFASLPDKVARILKTGGVWYIDGEISSSYWSQIRDYRLYLKELKIKPFIKDILFDFSHEGSSFLKRNLRKLHDVVALRDWKKLVRGISKRLFSAAMLKDEPVDIYSPEQCSFSWEHITEKLSGSCDILLQKDYLACRESDPAVWTKWNTALNDTGLFIIKKRI